MKNKYPYKNIILTVLSFIGGGILVYIGLKIFLSPEQLSLLISGPVDFHFYALILLLPLFVFGGFQTFILLKLVYGKSISLYDIITLPFILSLWGFLIPFQGAYIYNSIYFKAKYKIAIVNTTSMSIVSLSVSLILAGILGVVYSCFSYQNIYFLLLSVVTLIHPVFIFIFIKIFKTFKFPDHGLIKNILIKTDTVFADYMKAISAKNITVLSLLNLIDTFAFALWSYWISQGFGFDLSFFQLLMLQFFMKLTVFFKFTPGNLGVNQFASSGIILLVGGSLADGFTLSLYQTAIGLIASFLFGSVFSMLNVKYFFNKTQA